MKYRKLRIAWSVVWGMFCLALIALWVRSIWYWDDFYGKSFGGHSFHARSLAGQLFYDDFYDEHYAPGPWRWDNSPLDSIQGELPLAERGGFEIKVDQSSRIVYVSHWFAVLITGTIAAAPWLRWRF